MLREGYEAYRRYVNPLVALRAELLGEPTRSSATRDGQLVEPRGTVEDFHGTQTFGHRHPAISAGGAPTSSPATRRTGSRAASTRTPACSRERLCSART